MRSSHRRGLVNLVFLNHSPYFDGGQGWRGLVTDVSMYDFCMRITPKGQVRPATTKTATSLRPHALLAGCLGHR
jgi:hypothetical protein